MSQDNCPDSKVHGANMDPSGTCRPQMGPMLTIRALLSRWCCFSQFIQQWSVYSSVMCNQIAWFIVQAKYGIAEAVEIWIMDDPWLSSCLYFRRYDEFLHVMALQYCMMLIWFLFKTQFFNMYSKLCQRKIIMTTNIDSHYQLVCTWHHTIKSTGELLQCFVITRYDVIRKPLWERPPYTFLWCRGLTICLLYICAPLGN